jgi:hypothetical protein
MTNRPVITLPTSIIIGLVASGTALWIAGFMWAFGGAQ